MDIKQYKKYDRFYRFGRKVFAPFVVRKLGFMGQELPDDTGPMFILCNHNTDADFLLLSHISKRPLDYVATESMLRMGAISRIVAEQLKPILHDKGSKGTATIREIVSRIKDGRNVVLFPEGNRSFDGRTGEISSAIGKIVKMTGATLVIYKFTGGYFTTPRWGRGIRKGEMRGYVSAVLSPKELHELKADEILKIVEDGLRTDAYEEQKENPTAFKSKVKAEYLETLLFACPSCRKVGTMHSKGDKLNCSCGYSLTLDDYGYLLGDDGTKLTITDAFAHQKELCKEIMEADPDEAIWSDQVHMMKLTSHHSTVGGEDTTIVAYGDKLLIKDSSYSRNEIASIDIVQRNRLIIHVKGSDVRYEFTGGDTYNAVKYRIWYEISFV